MLLKRCTEVLLSLTALLLLAPVGAAIAVAIWLDSGGPVLFRQERVGLRFRRFRVWKFRTMLAADGPLITVAGDSRITRVGEFLRARKLDELPQLWNVLRGDMSLVGPRPQIPEYVELFRERYAVVLTVRPGITDLASIRFRNEEDLLSRSSEPLREYAERILPVKLRLAEEYIGTRTMFRDISILFHTAIAILGSSK
jgi:lipopolysaccharide/colanic/teichoic acid biosynthesis glycosyltransferase